MDGVLLQGVGGNQFVTGRGLTTTMKTQRTGTKKKKNKRRELHYVQRGGKKETEKLDEKRGLPKKHS